MLPASAAFCPAWSKRGRGFVFPCRVFGTHLSVTFYLLVATLLAAAPPAGASPFLPADDGLVLEQVPGSRIPSFELTFF